MPPHPTPHLHPLRRPRTATLLAATIAATTLSLALPACQTVRLGDQPIELEAAYLPAKLREPYTVLASANAFLDQRSAAARTLLDQASPASLEVLAWGLEASRAAEINQAVLQAIYAAADEPDEQLWWPLIKRVDSLPPNLTNDFALATSQFQGKPFQEQLIKLAQSQERTVQARTNAAAALGQRRTKHAAEALLDLTAADQPPSLRQAAFASLATLTGRDDLGADAAGWNQWWDQARSLNAANWERQLRENLVRREANQGITTDQLVDRLREQSTTLYRLASDVDKPRVLNSLLNETLLSMRELGVSLAEQRLASGGTFDEPLRQSLRQVLVDEPAELRQRAATLLRDLADQPAADRVAQRLADDAEHVTAVQAAYLLLLERTPRALAVRPAQALMQDSALGPQAAAALASAARADLLDDAQKPRVLRDVRRMVNNARSAPQPALITLTGQVGDDRDFQRIANWLDHPEPAVRQAAAQAWADSTRPLVLLAERADDPVIQPIVINAARQRGTDPQTLRTLALFPPTAGSAARQAWAQALVAMAAKVEPDQALAAARALPPQSSADEREALLTAALDAAPLGQDPTAAHMAMLLDRAELRLQAERPRLAALDFENLVPRAQQLTAKQRERLDRGLIRALLQTDQLVKAFGVARRLYEGPNGQLIQPAPDDPIIDLFIDAAESHVNANRRPQARRLLEELRLLLGPTMKGEVAARISDVEQRAQAGSTNNPNQPSSAQPNNDDDTDVANVNPNR